MPKYQKCSFIQFSLPFWQFLRNAYKIAMKFQEFEETKVTVFYWRCKKAKFCEGKISQGEPLKNYEDKMEGSRSLLVSRPR